ncbi:hypothetical protein MLD38_025724 [Melastoma candidum]|nr:hypothetical protein MLD38_025724 [Melastoma candidum]
MHGMAIKGKHVENAFVGNALIDMYGKCGSLFDAKRGLESLSARDHVSWNSLITACAVNGMVDDALSCLDEMFARDGLVPNLVTWSAVIGGLSQNGHDDEAVGLLFRMTREGFEPNDRTLASVLPSCSRLKDLNLGREIHGYVTRRLFNDSSYVVNGLLDLYRKCGDMRSAEFMFWKFSVRNEVSYNTMIVGYSENGLISEARELFDRMEAQGVKKSKISWNSMISGYVDNCLYDKAWDLYIHLLSEDSIEPDSFTLGSVLTACADIASLKQGRQIHLHAIIKGLHADPFVGGSLVELYGRCDELASAQLAFDQLHERDTSPWNALISGYSRCNETESIEALLIRMKQDGLEPNIYTWNGIISGYLENGHHDAALSLFSDMCSSSSKPDAYTIGMVTTACSRLATIDRGKQLHGHSIRRGFDSDIYITAALIDMYGKCGSIRYAKHVYDRIGNPNIVTQNAMLTTYAMHGLGEEGISLFRKMLKEGYIPDHVTFLSALSSCAHAGTVDTGWEFFYLMKHFGIKPSLKHYTCIVDLLCRAGRLAEAYIIIMRMPMEPDPVVWSALLGGCVVHGDIVLGEIAGKRLLELGADNTGNYVLLANLYGLHGRWSELARMRQAIKDRDMQKCPGCSWIEHRDRVHVFLAADMSHDSTPDIYATLDSLTAQMRLPTEISI